MTTSLAETAKSKGIRYFLVSFVDLFGNLRAKLVPASAIGEDAGGRYAFVVRDMDEGVGVAHRVEVTTGSLTNEGLEVLTGLVDGDYLVTAGVHRIIDGQRVKVPQQ